MSRPRIGLTLDLDADGRVYELRRSYADAVLAAGGLPILLPYADVSALGAYLAILDGLVISGGAFDVPPELYGEARRDCCGIVKPERTQAEKDLLEAALASRVPVLGVCGGMQLLNVVRGGSLHQDLAEAGLPGHEQPAPKDVPSHAVEVVRGTLLASLVGAGALDVNSTHHQAVREAGPGVLVSARAVDGVVEAIELPDLPFALGVQWHPEAALRHERRHARIYEGLVAAAAERRR